MRAYLVAPGARVWEFTEETAALGKGKSRIVESEEMFTEVVYDPVMLANGCALDPELYAEGFPHKVWKAAKAGYFVFHQGGYTMTAVHGNDLRVV